MPISLTELESRRLSEQKRQRDERVRRGVLTIFPPAVGNGKKKKPNNLVPFKTDSQASTWKYDTTFPDKGPVTLFVKANIAGESPLDFRRDREEARKASSLHEHCTPTHYGIFTFLSDEDVLSGYKDNHPDDRSLKKQMLDNDIRMVKKGIVRNYELHNDSIVIEFTRFIPGLTIEEILLQNMLSRDSLNSADITLLDKLCTMFHSIHRTPTDKELSLVGCEAQKIERRLELFHASLEKVVDRARTYLTIEKGHPVLSEHETAELVGNSFYIRQKMWDRVEYFRHTHGDAQARNCKEHAKNKALYALDWGRVTVTDYRVDWGRFICDLLWKQTMIAPPRNAYLLEVVECLLQTCERIYADHDFRIGVCLGIYALASIRLSKKELVGVDSERAHNFFKLVLPILRAQYAKIR